MDKAQPVQEPVAWNKQIRDSVDSLLEQAGYQPNSSARNALSMMNFDAQPLPVQPAQEPVAWAVQGCSKMWRGEFAEIDAKAEAKRIGGTCIAYALYNAPPQRQWIWLSDADIADVIDTTCQYTGSYEEYLIKKAEQKSRSMNNG
jgi:hypothetical protein